MLLLRLNSEDVEFSELVNGASQSSSKYLLIDSSTEKSFSSSQFEYILNFGYEFLYRSEFSTNRANQEKTIGSYEFFFFPGLKRGKGNIYMKFGSCTGGKI